MTAEDKIEQGGGPAGEEGFAEVYASHGRSLYGAALRILGSPEDAEEAMHDTFLTYHRMQSGLDRTQVGGWLRRVLVNRCIDMLRRRRRRRSDPLDEALVPATGGSPPVSLDLRRAVGQLPERARMVFLLHDVEGFPHHEVGEMMGITTGSSKSQLFRARRLLRGLMEPES